MERKNKMKPNGLYFDGVRWAGMTAWTIKAIYKVGKAGKRGKSVKLPAGAVKEYLIRNRIVMQDTEGLYMLTYQGQILFQQIKVVPRPKPAANTSRRKGAKA